MKTNDTKNHQVTPQRPFLKWAGGKFQIVDKIRNSLPEGGRLIEPFVGAGSVFMNTGFERYILNDINQDLIHVFNVLKKEKHSFINFVKEFFCAENNSKYRFTRLREQFNESDDVRLKSALFIYLNRHAFNGLMRYNQSGQFNTSFGDYKKPYFPENEMMAFAKKLHKANLQCGDFEKVMSMAQKGDVVYCDPPYVPLSLTANFTKYQGEGFGLDCQKRLVVKAKALAKRGIPVIISNHDTEFVQNLYEGAEITSFDVQRYISRQSNNRKKARELLAVFE